jgi:hypothetical protein
LTVYRGGKIKAGDGIPDGAMQDIVDSGQRTIVPSPASGLAIDTVSNTVHASLPAEIVDPANIRESFLAEVTDKGPDDEEDHEGAMYWVREVREVTPDDAASSDRVEIELRQDVLDDLGNEDVEALWLTAVNLAEYNREDPDVESHALVFGAPPIVQVFQFPITVGGRPRWYFTRSISGIQAGVVRAINEEEDTLSVVAVDFDDEGTLVALGDPQDLVPWYGIPAEFYRRFIWPADTPFNQATNVLRVELVNGEWRVHQHLKYKPLPDDASQWPHSDCLPIKEEEEE